MMLFLDAFGYGWAIGLLIFGLHLFLLGYLAYKSGYIPKILGILLIIASFGYLIDSSGQLLSSPYEANIALFTFIGEVFLIFWLFIKGARLPDQSKEEAQRNEGDSIHRVRAAGRSSAQIGRIK